MNATTPKNPSSKPKPSAGRGKTKSTESAAPALSEPATPQTKKSNAAAKSQPLSRTKSPGKAQTKLTGDGKAQTKLTGDGKAPTKAASLKPAARAKDAVSPPGTRAASTAKATGPVSKKLGAKTSAKPAASTKAATNAKKPTSTSKEAKAPARTAIMGKGSAKAGEPAPVATGAAAAAKAPTTAKPVTGTPGSATQPAASATAIAKPPTKAAAASTRKPAARKKTRASPRPEGFQNGSWVVHPSHGPGRVTGLEKQTIGGQTLELITVTYGREMARLKIPVDRLQELGLRPISSKAQIQAATNTLKKPAQIIRTMWSRRAQDYESKLHSGDLVQIAEVLRDLYRAPDGPEQSFSERELYKDALDRFSRELAAAEKNLTEEKAVQRLESVLRRAS